MIPRLKANTTAAIAAAGLAVLLLPAAAQAQSAGSSGMATYQSGYGGARASTSQAQTGSTRDQNGNRLIVDGIIQAGANTYTRSTGGVSSSVSGAGQGGAIGGSTAIGNNLNVVVQGNNNTVVVNSRQTNTGNVSAGTALNGTLRLP